MANKRISELPTGSTPTGPELIEAVQGGVNVKITAQEIADLSAGGGGTVTSVAALTLGTTGTDLSSSVANGTTTPVITLNVPTASATNRGALSTTDWSTFNSKQAAISFGIGVQTALGVNIGSAGAVVVNGGVLGTPSSGVLTNATGYLLNNIANPTGTTTLALSTNPLIFTSAVTTGTGATSGIQYTANSLTTGHGLSVSSSSLTSGNIGKITSTSTSHQHTPASGHGLLGVTSSGANSSTGQTSIGINSIVTNTGTTSTNYGGYFSASGGTTNYSLVAAESFLLGATRFLVPGSANNYNLFIGESAGNLTGGGLQNIGIGYQSLQSFTTATRTVAVGYGAFAAMTGFTFDNTAVGHLAGNATTTGSSNAFFGKSAGAANTTGLGNTYIGNNAGAAGQTNAGNTFVGSFAGAGYTANGASTIVGGAAGRYLTTGLRVTALGTNAFGSTGVTSAQQSIAVGYNALFAANGADNIGIGTEVYSANTAGTGNIGIGSSVGDGMTAGSRNIHMGLNTMAAAAGGDDNVMIGYNQFPAGVTTASSNVALGSGITGLTSGNNNIIFGRDLTAQSGTASNTLNIQNILFGAANSATGTTLSTGNIGIGVVTPAAKLDILQTALTTSGGLPVVKLTGGAHTVLTGGTEVHDFDLAFNRTVNFNTGALTNQRSVIVRAPTYSFFAASTITNAATVSITGAPVAGTNATFTNAYALNVEAGLTNLAGGVNTTNVTSTVAGLGKSNNVNVSGATTRTTYEMLWVDVTTNSGNQDVGIFAGYTDATAQIEFIMTAVKTSDGAEAYSAKKIASFHKDGSADATLVGSVSTIHEVENAATNVPALTISMNGANVRAAYDLGGGVDTYRWTLWAKVTITQL